MAEGTNYVGEDRIICHGTMSEGHQVPLKTGGSTLQFEPKDQFYCALQCVNEVSFKISRYKSHDKFSRGRPPMTSYTFHGKMKVHRIVMGQGNNPHLDAIIVVVHEKEPFYFMPTRQKVRRWYEAFKFVASILSSPRIQGVPSDRFSSKKLPESPTSSLPPSPCPPGAKSKDVHSPTQKGQRVSYFIEDDQEEPTPEHLTPNVIECFDVQDVNEAPRDRGEYEPPYTNTRNRQNSHSRRKSVMKRNKEGKYDLVDVLIGEEPTSEPTCDGSSDTTERREPEGGGRPSVRTHRALSRQKSKSNDDLSQIKEQDFHIQKRQTQCAQSSTSHVSRPPGTVQRINRTQSAVASHASSSVRPRSVYSPDHDQPQAPRFARPRIQHIYQEVLDPREDKEGNDDPRLVPSSPVPSGVSSDIKRLLDWLRQDKEMESTTVELDKAHVIDGLVYVEIRSKLYVANWKKEQGVSGNFQSCLHIGDELLQVNEQRVTNLVNAKTCISSSSKDKITLVVRRLPLAKVIYMSKAVEMPWDFEVKKNEITRVFKGSPLLGSIGDPKENKQKWVVTELNHQPISCETSKKDELRIQVGMSNTELALVLQPKDFIEKLIRNQKASVKRRKSDYVL